MKKNLLYKCLLLALAGPAVTAQAQYKKSTADADTARLGTVTIIGNRINAIDDTLPNVDVIQVSTLREIDVDNIQSALKRNPAIEVNTTQRQPQLYIRGMGENYTEITLDGQHLPEFFAFGPFSSGGRDFIETDTLKQIDIIKGLHSPKQKSSALAGTVNMRTYEPSDLVGKGRPTYFSFKTGYTSKDRGLAGTVTVAGGEDALKGMLIYTRRDYHEPKNMGSDATKTRRAKQDIKQNNLLAKAELNLENARFLLTGEVFDRDLKRTNRYPRRPGDGKPTDNPTKRSRLGVESEFYNLVNLDLVKVGASLLNYKQTDNQSGFGVHHYNQKNLNFHI